MSADLKYAIGKRRDGKGWSVIAYLGEDFEEFGPYRLQRDARTALRIGEIDKGWRERRPASTNKDA